MQLDNFKGHWEYPEYFDHNDYFGFVYEITHLPTGMKYIGKKFFTNKVTKKPLKGKTKKRHSVKESNWKEYTSSSKEVNYLIERSSKKDFKFEIISLHKSRWETNYYELKVQIDRGVLLSEKYLNGVINIRQGKPPKYLTE